MVINILTILFLNNIMSKSIVIDFNVIKLYISDVLISITLCFLNREGKKPASSLQAIGMLQAFLIVNVEPFMFCVF